ncbi:MAG: porin family protein [Geobacteraceae bacterium]|nr:porin family protein [Geobacteraceae bacterium]
MKMNFNILLLLLLLSLCQASSVIAADVYVRASAGVDWLKNANFSDDKDGVNPALFGDGTGTNGKPYGAYGDFDTYAFVEGAVGLRLQPWLRTEFSLTYRPDMHYSGQANFTGLTGPQPVSGDAESLSGLANLYLDINGLPGVSLGRFQPFVGGGIGFATNWQDEMTYKFPQLPPKHTYSIVPSGDRTDLAFMLTAGTGFELTKHLILEISYRYTDLGRAQTNVGTMQMDGSVTSLVIAGTSAPLRAHGMLMGLRYHF